MESLTKYPRIRFIAALVTFSISSIFTSYMAWSERQPTHSLLDNFTTGFEHVPLGWVEPTILFGLGLYFLYVAVEIPIPTATTLTSKAIRWFKKSIFFRFLPFTVFFALFGGFLFGPGVVYLAWHAVPDAYAFLAYGLYCLAMSLFFAHLPTTAAYFVRFFHKRGLTEAICRILCLIVGVISVIGAFIG